MQMPDLISQTQADPTAQPLLFVPDAFTGAWIWQDRFAPYFYERGFHTHAMTFAGHGRPRLKKSLRPLKHYVQQLRLVIDQLTEQHQQQPMLVAHSLGGLVTLKTLADALDIHIPAAVLLSSIPHDGVASSAIALAKKSPVSAIKFASLVAQPGVRHLGAPPIGIYSKDCDAQQMRAITQQLGAESPLALLTTLGRRQVDVQQIQTPCYFIAATGDYIIRPEDVRRTTEAMHAPLKVFEGMSHTFQAESNWQQVAKQTLAWLRPVD